VSDFRTPILFLIFNRPEVTEKVFNEIRRRKPKYLYVAADGPRDAKEGEREKCEITRKVVLNNIDWECDVKTLFRDQNLGCGRAVSEAITWFFENVEEGIILEDDCLPDPTFFTFCSELLARYRNDTRIYSITGSNFQDGIKRGNGSYYFSRFPYIWGWATWRRAWINYDFEMKELQKFLASDTLKLIFHENEVINFWKESLIKSKKIDTWDFQWSFTLWFKNAYSISANQTLVQNIGFGSEATHTKDVNAKISNMKIGKIDQILHPANIIVNQEADQYTFENYYRSFDQLSKSGYLEKVIKIIKQLLK
jgi:hypothetical protein